jgi:hypothetical protein
MRLEKIAIHLENVYDQTGKSLCAFEKCFITWESILIGIKKGFISVFEKCVDETKRVVIHARMFT